MPGAGCETLTATDLPGTLVMFSETVPSIAVDAIRGCSFLSDGLLRTAGYATAGALVEISPDDNSARCRAGNLSCD